MSTARRAYDMLRGYINNEYDRLVGPDRASAEKELEEARSKPAQVEQVPYKVPVFTPEEEIAHACRVLGVEESASFEDKRKAFERLCERSEPTRFPEGSNERAQAVLIQKRIQWAYQKLTESVDSTEKRFRTLEIE